MLGLQRARFIDFSDAVMLFVSRTLTILADGAEQAYEVRIFVPEPDGEIMACRVEIDCPDDPVRTRMFGEDAIDALYYGLVCVAANLYARDPKAETSYWRYPGAGYGFPYLKRFRHEMVGDDVILWGP